MSFVISAEALVQSLPRSVSRMMTQNSSITELEIEE